MSSTLILSTGEPSALRVLLRDGRELAFTLRTRRPGCEPDAELAVADGAELVLTFTQPEPDDDDEGGVLVYSATFADGAATLRVDAEQVRTVLALGAGVTASLGIRAAMVLGEPPAPIFAIFEGTVEAL